MTVFAAQAIGLHHPGQPRPSVPPLSLSIARAEPLRLTGPSGAGKTSLMRLIAGLEQPTTGRITTRPQRIGMVFAEPRLLPGLSALENLRFIQPQAAKRARVMLEDLGIGATADRPARQLSKGQAQRVALIRALLVGPELVLLDEAFGGLDPVAWQSCHGMIATEQARTGFALVEISHDPARLFAPMARACALPPAESGDRP